jgi:hypothetical protein
LAPAPFPGDVGTKVPLNGKNLDGITKVLFGTAAKVFSWTLATSCTAVAAKGVSGRLELQVITPTGTINANPSGTFTSGDRP